MYSDVRPSTTEAQQLIKHLNLCLGQQSLRDFKENVTVNYSTHFFIFFFKGRSALRGYAKMYQTHPKLQPHFNGENTVFISK